MIFIGGLVDEVPHTLLGQLDENGVLFVYLIMRIPVAALLFRVAATVFY